MKAILLMFDSLNRHMLPPYGCDWVQAPNFSRLAQRSVTFDRAYVGSMPCIPARRELHTGRYNFLHANWGPLEPYDDSMPRILAQKGIHSHLVSDHVHYWAEGGSTYHTHYSTWEGVRGQSGDAWKARLRNDFHLPKEHVGHKIRQDFVNRHYMQREEDTSLAKTFALGLEFLDTNGDCDNWFLQIETFGPHEPWFVPQKYVDLYEDPYKGPHFDWPIYGLVDTKAHSEELIQHARLLNAAYISMCDAYLGKVLDKMDALGLWNDTMLIVNTDHGFMLGEKGWWAKAMQPWYGELAHIPFFVWDPRSGVQGERRGQLVQTIDIPATLLEYFGQELPKDMEGLPLRETIASGRPVHEAGLFGMFGQHVNVTDGRYIYMRATQNPENKPLYQHTLMPMDMFNLCKPQQLQDLELAGPFSFTKGCRLLKFPGGSWSNSYRFGNLLFDTESDPRQENPIPDAAVEERMIGHLIRLMRCNDAPKDQFERLGL